MESEQNLRRMQKCPHFHYCNAVKCPLDELMGKRVKLSEDKDKCRLRRSARLKLGADMKTRGLTLHEIASLKKAYGSLHKAVRAILRLNFSRKKKRKP